MALDDYLESEVAIAVAATTAVLSPPVRRLVRRGAVLGLAGVLMAGDMVGAVMRGAQRGMQQASTATQNAAQSADGARPAADLTTKADEGGAAREAHVRPSRATRTREAQSNG